MGLGRYADKVRKRLNYLAGASTNHFLMQIASKLKGSVERECSACEFIGRFIAFGDPPRYDAQCPSCGALERHRLLALALEGVLQSGGSLLHFAPEAQMRALILKAGVTYRSADLSPDRADLLLNIEGIELPSEILDYVMANHVLEHVDDRKALSEIWRILRPGGLLIATVPIIEGWDETYENRNISDPHGRELHFGQWDHVRYYGRDFRNRVTEAGFLLTEFVGSGEQTVRYALLPGERVFFCRKAS